MNNKKYNNSNSIIHNPIEKTDEKINDTRNALKTIKKNIPIGADVLYVTVSHILENSESTYYESLGVFIIIILISFCIALYQYLLISSQNKWYYNSLYSCNCRHCIDKKFFYICKFKMFKHKIYGLISAVLQVISFIIFVYFHKQPFDAVNLYNAEMSFIFLIVWLFINGLIHKIVNINPPRYVIINMKYIKDLKEQRKKMVSAEYRKKFEKCLNGLTDKHIDIIKNIKCKDFINQNCTCVYELGEIQMKELELKMKEHEQEQKESILEIADNIEEIDDNIEELDKQLNKKNKN